MKASIDFESEKESSVIVPLVSASFFSSAVSSFF